MYKTIFTGHHKNNNINDVHKQDNIMINKHKLLNSCIGSMFMFFSFFHFMVSVLKSLNIFFTNEWPAYYKCAHYTETVILIVIEQVKAFNYILYTV